MDRFSELRAFIAVVDAGGFSAGARELGQSRSAVNRLVIALEDRLGAQLLNRSTRKVAPTSDGRAFYDRARRILDDLEEAETAIGLARAEAIGRMRINAPLTEDPINLSTAVRDFIARHPRVEIDLTLETRLVDPVAEGYDVVVRVGEPDEDSMLVDHRLATFEYIVCAAPEYLARQGTPRHPSDLKAHRLLNFNGERSARTWRFVGADGICDVPVTGPLCANAIEPVREAALAGLGVAVLPSIAVGAALKRGALRRVLSDYQLPTRVLQAIYPPARRLSAKVRLFTDFLIERFNRIE